MLKKQAGNYFKAFSHLESAQDPSLQTNAVASYMFVSIFTTPKEMGKKSKGYINFDLWSFFCFVLFCLILSIFKLHERCNVCYCTALHGKDNRIFGTATPTTMIREQLLILVLCIIHLKIYSRSSISNAFA